MGLVHSFLFPSASKIVLQWEQVYLVSILLKIKFSTKIGKLASETLEKNKIVRYSNKKKHYVCTII